MKYELRGSEWHVCIEITANGAYITDGAFGEINFRVEQGSIL